MVSLSFPKKYTSNQIKLDGALFYADPADLKETDKFLRSQNISRKKEKPDMLADEKRLKIGFRILFSG